MRSYPGTILAALCLIHTAAAHAQETPAPVLTPPPSAPVASVASGDPTSNSLHEGVWGLSFQIPTGGSPWLNNSIGAWYMFTPRLNLGLNLNLNIDPEQGVGTPVVNNNGVTTVTSDTYVNVTLIIAPEVKYYLTTSGPVAPYFVGQLRVGFSRSNTGDTTTGGDTAGVLSLAGGFGIEIFPWKFLSIGGTVGINLDLLRPQAAQRAAALQTVTSAMYATVYFQ